jgi:hypothetical protein
VLTEAEPPLNVCGLPIWVFDEAVQLVPPPTVL